MKKSVLFFKTYKNLFFILGISLFIIFLAADIYLYFYFTPRCSDFKGDANGDRKIDDNDIGHINSYFAGGELNCRENADINEDGSVDIYDGEELLSYFSRGNKFSPDSGSGGAGEGTGTTGESGDGSGNADDGSGEIDRSQGAFDFWKDYFSNLFGVNEKEEDKPGNNAGDKPGNDAGDKPGNDAGDNGAGGENTGEEQNPYSNDLGSNYQYGGGGGSEQQSTNSCTNNPAFPVCNGELSCSIEVGCDCYQECSNDANWCWGSANKFYTCQSSCAVSGKYAPSSHDCCIGLEYLNGECTKEKIIGVKFVSCDTNPVGQCDGVKLSCDLGYACDCNEECASNICSESGKCIYIAGIKPADDTYTEEPSSSPTPTSSSSQSGSPIGFSLFEEKPFYQRLSGWVTKTITGWFTSE